MITKQELFKVLEPLEDNNEIIFIGNDKIFNKITRYFYDSETNNLLITLEEFKNKK